MRKRQTNHTGSRKICTLLLALLMLLALTPAPVLAAAPAAAPYRSAQVGTTVTSVRAGQKKVNLLLGDRKRLSAVAYNGNDVEVKNVTFTWKSSRPAVVSVTNKGYIRGLKPGTSRITATEPGGKKITVTVKVVRKQVDTTEIKVRNAPEEMDRGDTCQLKMLWKPSKATSVVFTYKSSRPGVVAVDAAGTLTAKRQGTAKITVKGGRKSATFTVKVNTPDAAGVSLDTTELSLAPGATRQLTSSVHPAGAIQEVSWASSNTSVAKVDSDGLVTAISEGAAVITASTDNNRKTSCYVKVEQQDYTVYDVNTGRTVTDKADKIVAEVVTAEMGVGHNPEAYKALAVATRSWLEYEYAHGNKVPHVALRPANAAVTQAVALVSNQLLTMGIGGPAILAETTHSNGGYTNSAADYWGRSDLNYLTAQADPFDHDHSNLRSSWTKSQMSAAIRKMTGSTPTGPEANWVPHLIYGSNHYIKGASVNGTYVPAYTFFSNLYGLYSPRVTDWQYNPATEEWVALTSGDGHGVGLSITGAINRAAAGQSYGAILGFYYPTAHLSYS